MNWKFWSRDIKSPITEEDQNWLEDAFLWYEDQFGRESLTAFKTLTPTKSDFNWEF